nr:hypothetical protein [Tanacetum cinerariifolium]
MSEIYKSSLTSITPDFLITDSLKMEDKHLDTILEMESDEENKSSVEDLNLTPSESEDLSDIKNLRQFNVESDLIDSLLKQDSLIISSPKIDSLLQEFSGELDYIDLIPPGINEADFDPKEEILLVEKLLYDNTSPRPLEEFNSKNFDINYFSLSLSPLRAFHFDHYFDPSSPRPPMKPPDDDEIYFDAKPDTGVLTAKVVDDIFERYVYVPDVLPTLPTHYPVIDTLLLFSSKNEDKVFNLGILASKEEKTPHL